MRSFFSFVAVVSLGIVTAASADTIFLKNGRDVEGIIESENKTEIVLDIGLGSMTIKRNNIKSITRSTEEQNARILAGWQKDYFLQKRYVPEGLEDLAAGFRNVSVKRLALLNAVRASTQSKAGEAKLREEVLALQARLLEISKALADTKPEKDAQAYNTLVARNNALTAEIAIKHDKLDKNQAAEDGSHAATAEYITALSSCSDAFEKKRAGYSKEQKTARKDLFFEEISKRLEAFRSECAEYSYQTRTVGNSATVSVTLNDTMAAILILDTGASTMTISEQLAGKLLLDASTAPETRVTLADGKMVAAKTVMLKSVKLGDARVENIQAVVLPSPPSQKADGLLGMNFLRNFVVNLDNSTGKLTLKQFKSGQK